MADIVVFGGTTEGRIIAETFCNTKLNIHICVATDYGAELLPSGENIHIYTGRMTREEIEEFINNISLDFCLDATHPYALEITENIYSACRSTDINYIRVIRKEEMAEGIIYAESIEKVAELLNKNEGNILIATGSKELEKYTEIKDYEKRCFPRILPSAENIEKCHSLGFESKNITAMQGPFSEEMNYCLLKHINAKWLVTKSSGKEGGFIQKCNAALRAGAGIIVIGRKDAVKGDTKDLNEVLSFIANTYNLNRKRKIYLIGMGPGKDSLITKEAEEYLNKADVIIGAKRITDICNNKPKFISYKYDEIISFINENPQHSEIALVYSGDIGFYSGAKNIREKLKDFEIYNISGISSPVYFLNKLGKSWEDTFFVSCHGQSKKLAPLIYRNKSVCTLLGDKNTVSDICKALIDFNLTDIKITLGERLSYPDEKITSGYPDDFIDVETDSLSVVLFENTNPFNKVSFSIKDSEFIRESVPMTKEEVRTVSISKLGLDKNSVLYDIGAGTGSISVESALKCPEGIVYAIEKNPKAIGLIKSNKIKFKAENIEIIEGEAPAVIESLPIPTHVFIGGSGGNMVEIIKNIRKKNKSVRFVLNIVTLESLICVKKIAEEYPEYENMEIIQLSVSRNKKAGNYNLMTAENPVYIVSFGGEELQYDS